MKRVLTVIVASVALAGVVATTTASAATPVDKRVAALERQVKALQAQVKILKRDGAVIRKTVDANQTEARNEAARNRVGDACMALAVADVFQATWTIVDQRVATAPAFGPQQPLDDVSCKAIGVTRPGIDSPTVAPFWALTGWLIG
jgi:hypothetical protein